MSDIEQEDPRLRFRLWVDRELVDETWLDASNPDVGEHIDRLSRRHVMVVEAADRNGSPWLVECYDPAQPKGKAYARYGTDPAGMVDPKPLA